MSSKYPSLRSDAVVLAETALNSGAGNKRARPRLSGTGTDSLMDLSRAIHFFNDKYSETKVHGNQKLQMALENIQKTAKADGLSNDDITSILDVACSARFSDAVNSKLIKSLLPNEKLSEQVILNCISWICTNRPSAEIQVLLSRWMVLVFDVVDGKDKIHSLYGVIFNLIESDLLCPHICHLLYLLTCKEDVMSFRVKKLLNLQKRVGAHPHISGLLSVYKLYRPSWLSVMIPSSQRIYFKKTGARVWEGDMKNAKDRICQSASPAFDVNATCTNLAQKSKRRRQELIPRPSSSNFVEESGLYNFIISESSKVPVSQIKTFHQLLINLDRLELPSRVGAVLQSPLLQHALSCTKDEDIIQRLSFWLYQTLHEELLDCDDAGNNPRAEHLLQLLINFTEFLQEDIPVSESFLVKYLYVWNGLDYRPYILQLITRFRIHPFQKLNDLVLEPLRKLFFCSSVYFKCQLIYSLTELLRHYLEVELPKHRVHRKEKTGDDGDAADKTNCDLMFEELLDRELAVDTIQQLVSFVDKICCVGLQQENENSLLLYHVLSFYDLISVMFRNYYMPFVCVPSFAIVYKALLSNNAVILCRICKIICNYKEEYNKMKRVEDSSLKAKLKEGIKTLNQYIIDFSNALWRNMVFVGKSKTLVFDIPMNLLQKSNVTSTNIIFSIQQHVALSGFSYKFLKETQAIEDFHPIQIKGNTRNEYVQFLSNECLDGIVSFINTFIKRGSSTVHVNSSHSRDESG
ncbi:centromere protein I-like [Antedon mediterranea]|uniref:centromere protein I-like n=1 Tax=Antedon mediterranea TaxID=105859 RepID=UPI003AF520F3